jgi:chemotaxis protein methyltransferase WspC
VSADLRRWIREVTGLLITDQNAAPVDLALRIQAQRLHIPPTELLRRLINGSIGAQGFIDEITTHESYFFRAREQMQLVVERLIPERLRRAPGRRVRVLSLPCARGEEPYSLAILLEEAGIPPTAVEIQGGDIAHACIEAAHAGVYGPLALRRTDPARAQRWFRRGGEQALYLDPDILARVGFRRVNLLRDAERLLRGPFDIVFCENLLIYFDTANVERALGIIARLLAGDGWLFVDHAEWNLPRALFRMQELAGRVGFRPPGVTPRGRRHGIIAAATPPRPVAPATALPRAPRDPPGERLPRSDELSATTPPQRIAPATTPPGWRQQLELARAHYADKRFTEALLGFEQVLRLRPALPAALLGKARVLADCGEDFEALEALEALLSPEASAADAGDRSLQVDALSLMAVLLHKKGLGDLAAQYLRRVSMLDPHHVSLGLLERRCDG